MTRRSIYVDGIVPVSRGYPSAVVSNGLVFVSGVRSGSDNHTPAWNDLPKELQATGTGYTLSDQLEGQVAIDSWAAHQNLDRVLQAVGSNESQILRQHIWQNDKRFFPIYERVRMARQSVPAPSSGLGVSSIIGRYSRWVGLDALAVVPGESALFPKRETVRRFDNRDFPSASFYSQAVRCGPLVSLAGHIPIATDKPSHPVITGFGDVPETGRFLATGRSHPDSRQGPIAAQSWFTYDCIRANLAAQGLGMQDVAHVTVYLQDIRDFGTFHRVHRHYFPDEGPALVIVGFDEVGHRGTRIEIEPTVAHSASGVSRKSVPWPIKAPFSGAAAVSIGPLWLYAGVLGINGDTEIVNHADQLDDPVGRRVAADLARFESHAGFAAQCWAALRLLQQVCVSSGCSLTQLTKTTVYMRSARDLWIYEEIREIFIKSADLPAVEFVAVQSPGPVPDAHLQIEAAGCSN